MINKLIITYPEQRQIGCIIALPGRGMPAESMDLFLRHCDFPEYLKVVIEPVNLEWYPQPNGAHDQLEAVLCQEETRDCLMKEIRTIQHIYKVNTEDISLVGYSAGAVTILDLLMHNKKHFRSLLVIAGAILEPATVRKARVNTPICLKHNYNDDVFNWEERYAPMKEALISNGYNVRAAERWGDHTLTIQDAQLAHYWINQAHYGTLSKTSSGD